MRHIPDWFRALVGTAVIGGAVALLVKVLSMIGGI